MFRGKAKDLVLVLVLGLGIGILVLFVTSWWYHRDSASIELNTVQAETTETVATVENDQNATNVTYHFGLENGVLSVIEGNLGVSGKVILTGLSVEAWPKEMLEIAHKVEFYSLDEVQSFIDTVNESLWQE